MYDLRRNLENALDELEKEVKYQEKIRDTFIPPERSSSSIAGVKVPLLPMQFQLVIDNSPPPITLLINPNNLSIKEAAKVSPIRVRQTGARDSGYILHTHHNELTVLSMSGRSAMFYNANGIGNDDFIGSLAWNNIQNFLALYRNNGINYNSYSKFNGRSHIRSVGHIEILYDGTIYKGHFNSLSLSEEENNPNIISFDLEFKAIEIKDTTNQISDIFRNLSRGSNRTSIVTDRLNDDLVDSKVSSIRWTSKLRSKSASIGQI